MQTFSISFFCGWFFKFRIHTRPYCECMLKMYTKKPLFGKWKIFFVVFISLFIYPWVFWWIKRSHTVKIQFCKLFFVRLVVVVDFCIEFFVFYTTITFLRSYSFFLFYCWIVDILDIKSYKCECESVYVYVSVSQKAKERKNLTALIRRSNKSIVFNTVYAYPRLTKKRKTETQ